MTGALTLPQIRFLAGLFTNLSASWLVALFVTPNFVGFDLKTLIYDSFGVIICSWLAIKFEEKIKNEQ